MKVGLVTTIHFKNALLDNFRAGLRNSGWGWQDDNVTSTPGPNGVVRFYIKEALGEYAGENKNLDKWVKEFNADESVSMILAVGGLPAAHAAAKNAKNKPYLVMIGTTPSADDFKLNNGKLRGGVNLDNVSKNTLRNKYICKWFNNINPQEVCLIYNNNNKELKKVELPKWKWPAEAVAANEKKDLRGLLATAFHNAKNKHKAKGVVISHDPLFSFKLDDVVAAANKAFNDWGLVVCYPFEHYAKLKPAENSGIWFGPNLEAAYRIMGEKTGSVLFDPATTTGLDTVGAVGPVPLPLKSMEKSEGV
jgi:hypothetical protein